MPALSRQFGVTLKAAIGVASGWAHVGRLGSSDGKDYTAIGDVVNLAARLDGQAHGGEIVVDEPIYRQVADTYPGVEAEQLELKGFAQPVEAYRFGSVEAAVSTSRPRQSGFVEGWPRREFSVGAILFAILGLHARPRRWWDRRYRPRAGLRVRGAEHRPARHARHRSIRIPLMVIATLGACANLWAVWHGHRSRQQASAEDRFVPLTRLTDSVRSQWWRRGV